VWCGGGGGGDGDDEWKFRLLRLIRPSATELVNACDAGREGELIFREIYEQSNSKLPFKRLWISSLTDEAIQEGYEDGLSNNNMISLLSAPKRVLNSSIASRNCKMEPNMTLFTARPLHG